MKRVSISIISVLIVCSVVASLAASMLTPAQFPNTADDLTFGQRVDLLADGYRPFDTVFDSNGDFHPYPVSGFNYTSTNENPTANGTYYVKSGDEYLLLMHHDTYYHLIDENTARIEHLYGTQVYGNVKGTFVPLSRNLSGLWLYGEEQLL